ncbi:MAG: hypothetical protein L0229_20345 [Blastocatellia bacterium]|nr:hypothetical protein [Blastocatellia bacterium]
MKPDRIDRAHNLIARGLVTAMGPNCWHVQSDRHNIGYQVTADGCLCYDYTETLKGQSPCKHILASEGATVVEAVVAMRAVSTVDELYRVGQSHADAIRTTPALYQAIARAEFVRLRAALRAGYRRAA